MYIAQVGKTTIDSIRIAGSGTAGGITVLYISKLIPYPIILYLRTHISYPCTSIIFSEP